MFLSRSKTEYGKCGHHKECQPSHSVYWNYFTEGQSDRTKRGIVSSRNVKHFTGVKVFFEDSGLPRQCQEITGEV